MALPRRAPREGYTVFSESDFMAGAEGAEMFAPDTASDAGRTRAGRVAGRALAAAVLAAAVVTVLAHRALGPAPGHPAEAAGSIRGSRAGQSRPKRISTPPPVLTSERRVRISLSTRRPTIAVDGPHGAVAAMARNAGQVSGAMNASQASGEVARGAITPSETAEFGFEH